MKEHTILLSITFLLFLLIISPSFSHSTIETDITTAGITPDSWFYGLDVAIDRISLLLTFDNTAKARKGLEIARERLIEVREMVLQNKLDAAQKGEKEYANTLANVKDSIGGIKRTNSTQEIKEEIELEKELEEHEKKIEIIKGELKIKIKIKGNITAEQQNLIDFILNSMENKSGEIKIKIDNKKGETKIKIKLETGKSDKEIEDDIEDIERSEGLTAIKQERALDRIEHAREEITEVKILRINATNVNITAVNELINLAETHLANAERTYNESKYGEAFGQATSALNLAKNAKRLLEKEEIEKEIEVEIKGNIAKIDIEIAGIEMKYTLNITNLQEIINDIANRTGLSVEEINAIIKLEESEESKLKIKAEVKGNQTKVEVEINEIKSKFTLNITNREDIISEIMTRTGLIRSEVESVIKINTEED